MLCVFTTVQKNIEKREEFKSMNSGAKSGCFSRGRILGHIRSLSVAPPFFMVIDYYQTKVSTDNVFGGKDAKLHRFLRL